MIVLGPYRVHFVGIEESRVVNEFKAADIEITHFLKWLLKTVLLVQINIESNLNNRHERHETSDYHLMSKPNHPDPSYLV